MRLLAFIWLVSASAVAAQTGTPQSNDAAAQFGARPSVEDVDISPDGRHILYLTPGPGPSTVALVQSLDGAEQPRVALRASGNPERLRWCRFVTDDRIVCQVDALISDSSGLIPFSRLLSSDIDGNNPKMLGERPSIYDTGIRQYDGAILDWLPGDDGNVLMARTHVPEARAGTRLSQQAEGLSVERIDVRNLHSTTIEPANRMAAGYMTDGRGHVRIMRVTSARGSTGMLGARVQFMYRTAGSSDWHPFSTYDDDARDGEYPIGVDPELDVAYTLRRLNGRLALYRVKLDGSLASELVYANDHVDVDDVVRLAHGSRIVGVSTEEDVRHDVYFDPAFRATMEGLHHALPNLPILNVVGASRDGNRLLVHGSSDTDPGRYYVYDQRAHSLNEILVDRPQLDHVTLATVRAVSYPAADGTQIPAYLTLPAGSDGHNLPAIVLPHGGPEARDVWGFDWLPQYFAHLGYAVLQPNYRGSAGYGDAWFQQNGFRGWRTSIGDITAGARWLAAQGIADPRREAIVGWSYGGYAALQAGATEPGLFRAIVAIAPVTDLQQLKTDRERFADSVLVNQFVGSGPHVTEGSPVHNAAAITAPVLLFQGDRDFNVTITHSRRMQEALQAAGKQSELTVFPGLEHDLDDSNARTQMLRRIGDFLAADLRAQ